MMKDDRYRILQRGEGERAEKQEHRKPDPTHHVSILKSRRYLTYHLVGLIGQYEVEGHGCILMLGQ